MTKGSYTSKALSVLAAIGALLGGVFKDVIVSWISEPLGPGSSPTVLSTFQVNYLHKDNATTSLKPILPDTVLHSGDQYKIVFTPNNNGYVYIFQVDSSEQCFQIFPMHEFKGVKLNNVNPVTAGRQYILPAENKSFRLDKNVGRERIYLVITPYPDAKLESLAQQLEEMRRSGNSESLASLNTQLMTQVIGGADGTRKSRGFDAIETDVPINVSWGDSKEVFNALGRSLRDICENCVYGIEFEHK